MTQSYPAALPDTSPASAKAGYPRYGTAGDFVLGAYGDDVNQNSATLAIASASGAAAASDYVPRHQGGKATLTSNTLAADVLRRRGAIAPMQPYPKSGDAAAATPTITGLSPNTAAAGSQPLFTTITGTGFTVWSTVHVGANTAAATGARFVNSTTMTVDVHPEISVAGTAAITVRDHGATSAPSNFTFT